MSDERNQPTDVYVLQPGSGESDPNSKAVNKTWGNGQRWVVIQNVAEMIDEIRKRCGERGYLRVLRIGGHGTEGSFRLGKISYSVANVEDLSSWLRDMHPYVKPGKTLVQLDHCNVGHAETLMKRLAVLMGGVTVMGPNSSQYTNAGKPVYEGIPKGCEDYSCTTTSIAEGTICTGKTCITTHFANDDPRHLVQYVRDWEMISGASVLAPQGPVNATTP